MNNSGMDNKADCHLLWNLRTYGLIYVKLGLEIFAWRPTFGQ